MKLRFRYLLALVLASLFMQEVHELSHQAVCRLIGACEGKRYFLYWDTCDTGNGFYNAMIYLAGPFTNFLMLWLGYKMLAVQSASVQKSYGATLVLAAIPLQRLQGIVFRGSDEINAFKEMFGVGRPFKGASLLAGTVLISLIVLPALYRLYLRAKESKMVRELAICLIVPYLINFGLQKLAFHFGLPSQYQPLLPSVSDSFSRLLFVDLLLLIGLYIFAASFKTFFFRGEVARQSR